MDARKLLDELLNSGKEMLGKGKDLAEDKLGVPESGENRDAMMSGLGKGAIAGGLLALLIGTKTGRKVTGKAVKYGSLAALAGGAYMAYQAWQNGDDSDVNDQGTAIADLDEDDAEKRGLLLVRSMIAAANADGHIDQDEVASITKKINEFDLPSEVANVLRSELSNPKSVEELAQSVDSLAAASEVYLSSSIVIDDANPDERSFLSRLAEALKMPPNLVAKLEAQAAA